MTSSEKVAIRSAEDWRTIGQICAAHVIALRDGGLIGDEGLAILLRAITFTRESQPPSQTSLLALIVEFDQRVDAITPVGYSGAANIGRGEIDLAATAARIRLRRELAGVATATSNALSAFTELATAHLVSLMPGLVDGQIAQPTTFGHLLGGVIGPVSRAQVRLERAYETTNRSPFGSGSFASTGMAIDRDRLAELLGFDGLVANTFDAVNASDHFTETADAIEAIVLPIRRWCNDILLWMRTDPGTFMVETAVTSLVGQLPQARFPTGLIDLSADARAVEQFAANLRTLANATGFAPLTSELDTLSRTESDLIDHATDVLNRVAAFVTSGLTVNRALLANRAGKGFSTASDLAEFMMLEEQIDPGSARNIASLTISSAREQGLEAAGITQELIDGAALMVIGQEIKVEFEAISRYLAPRRFIERRSATGAPSPASTRAYLEQERDHVKALEERWKRSGSKLDRALADLTRLETEALESDTN